MEQTKGKTVQGTTVRIKAKRRVNPIGTSRVSIRALALALDGIGSGRWEVRAIAQSDNRRTEWVGGSSADIEAGIPEIAFGDLTGRWTCEKGLAKVNVRVWPEDDWTFIEPEADSEERANEIAQHLVDKLGEIGQRPETHVTAWTRVEEVDLDEVGIATIVEQFAKLIGEYSVGVTWREREGEVRLEHSESIKGVDEAHELQSRCGEVREISTCDDNYKNEIRIRAKPDRSQATIEVYARKSVACERVREIATMLEEIAG